LFSIGFALSRSRDLLCRLLREHAPDDAHHELAERVVKHLEAVGVRDRRGGEDDAEAPVTA
jgi:hypothetical protein